MSVNREANVNRKNPTPAEKSVTMKTETGRKYQVAWRGNPVATRIASNGTMERTRLTSPTPIEEATKTERGM
jgi:hypothetical protein